MTDEVREVRTEIQEDETNWVQHAQTVVQQGILVHRMASRVLRL
jgi:hypothetical protein